MKDRNHRYAVSVLVEDRIGALHDTTSAMSEMGANIDGISQTVVEGYFTVILTVSFPENVECGAVERAIESNFNAGEANIIVRPYHDKSLPDPVPDGERYMLTLAGTDAPSIMKTVTGFLASKSINIEDWYVVFHGSHVTHVGAIRVPRQLDLQELQDQLQAVLSKLNLKIGLQHENIFRATNEVGPIRSLLMETADA